jgi:hypothetical protein
MKLSFTVLPILIGISFLTSAQKVTTPDLSKVMDHKTWTVYNRVVTTNSNSAHVDTKKGDGLVRLNDFIFENGTIDLDIKGQNKPGGSFVGFAFHGLNDSTFEAIYFRPFNFKSPERKTHSVQYVSHPTFPWYVLREKFPDKYENVVDPVPNPDDWFHATIVIEYPSIKVYVNNSSTPSLVVDQLSDRKKGWLGFWVGTTSEGDFRNLKISKK